MNSATILISLFICVAFVSAGPTGEPGKKYHHHDHQMKAMKCLGTDVKFTSEMQNKTASCFKGNKTEGKIDHSCSSLCKFQAIGVLDASGKVKTDSLTTVVKSVFPEAAQEKLIQSFTTCAKEKGAHAAVKEEAGKKVCGGFKDMFKCIDDGLHKICKHED